MFFIFAAHFCAEIALAQFDALAIADGLEDVGYLCQCGVHQQETYGGEDRAIDDAEGWHEEAAYDKHDADDEGCVKGFHNSLRLER